MKKILYMLLAISTMLAASCTNENIDIEVEYPQRDINLSIAVSEAYDVWGITDYENILGYYPNSYIEVRTFLYDHTGKLVDEDISHLRQFEQVNHRFTVDAGKYTALTISTVVEKINYSYKSDVWDIIDIKSLSTIAIENVENYMPFWYHAIYIAYKEINIDKQDVSIGVTPKVTGSIMDVAAYNFDKINDIELLLGTTGKTSGIKLNPELKGKDRYYYKEGINKEMYNRLWDSNDGSYTVQNEANSTIYILEEAVLPIVFGQTNKENSEKGIFYSGDDIFWNFKSGSWYRAAFYYIGGEKEKFPVNYLHYIDDINQVNKFNEWKSAAQAIYEENQRNNDDNENSTNDPWEYVGIGTFTDEIIAPSVELDPVSYDVEIFEHADSTGLYRIMNPYAKGVYPYDYAISAEDGHYLLINACDPNGVFVPKQSLGLNLGRGEMHYESVGANILAEGYSFEDVKSTGFLGRVLPPPTGGNEGEIIILPTFKTENSEIYYHGYLYDDENSYYCIAKNHFKVVLPYTSQKSRKQNAPSSFVHYLEKEMNVSRFVPLKEKYQSLSRKIKTRNVPTRTIKLDDRLKITK